MAGLRKLRGKYYARIRIFADGKQKEKLIPLHTKQEAKALKLKKNLEEKEKLYKSGLIGVEQLTGETLPDNNKYIDEFIEFKKLERNISKKTVELYNFALDTLVKIFENRNLTSLNQSDYKVFLTKMKKRYSNDNTLNIRFKSIKTFFNWMVEVEYIKQPPFKIKKIPVAKKQPMYFSDMEFKKILEATENDREFNSTLKFYWKTGLRLREIQNTVYHNGYIRTFNPVISEIYNSLLATIRIPY